MKTYIVTGTRIAPVIARVAAITQDQAKQLASKLPAYEFTDCEGSTIQIDAVYLDGNESAN